MSGTKIRSGVAKSGAVLLALGMLALAVSHGCGQSEEEEQIVAEPAAAETAPEPPEEPTPVEEPESAPDPSADTAEVAQEAAAEAAAEPAAEGGAASRMQAPRPSNRIPNDFLPATKSGGFLQMDPLMGAEHEDQQRQQGVVAEP